MILRFAYDFEGKAFEKEPLSLKQILSHMNQVSQVVKPYGKEILLYQGLFVGSWGEMHSSRYVTDLSILKLYDEFRNLFGKEVFLALRTIKQLFFFEGGQRVGNLELTYSANDNRCQSIDANQLVRGVEECDPYLLASLFRYTRSTSILKKAKGKQGEENVEYNVSTTLNNDKSIHTMTVSKGAESITYTFNY